MMHNPRTTTYEFFGPVGAFIITLGLPLMIAILYSVCNKNGCSILEPHFPTLSELFSLVACLILIAWFLLHVVIYMLPVGRVVSGTYLRDGTRLKYKINGLHAFIISHIVFIIGYVLYKIPVRFVYDNYIAMATASIFFSFLIAFCMYTHSFYGKRLLALGGNSGNPIYDFFIGRELNPRNGSFDWKAFCELRPGLIGWVMINYCMLVTQYENHGVVSTSMILVCVFQCWYVLDALWFEEAILTTMDIVHDGFGFMLVFGDLSWVPFTYSLQSRFLVDNPTQLPLWFVSIIIGLKVFGYAIFRLSNLQKDKFRKDPSHPSVRHLKTLKTYRGTKLIISGWWGMCRHPNYVGDLIMALSWSLPCGFTNLVPYFYVIYFSILLIHRQLRDEEQCRKKYEENWDQYCKIVKWRLIPGLY